MRIDKQPDFSGQIIDKFHIEKRLDSYPTCSLYLAHESGTDKPVYLQIMNVSPESDGELDGRFRQQMRTLSQLKHPVIAPILRIGRTPDNHSYATIQHIAGVSLAQKLAEWRAENQQLGVKDALAFVRHLADALALTHPSGIVHHDLRPENILVQDDNRPALIDLGVPYIAQKADDVDIQKATTLDYAAPEQLHGEAISGRSNIFSMGVILYELLAGFSPEIPVSSWDIFERATLPKEVPLEKAKPGLPEEVYSVVTTCLWRQEWSRFDTAYTLVNALDTAAQAEETQEQRLLTGSRFPRWLYVVVPALLLIGVLALFLLTRQGSGTIEATPLPETAVSNPTATLETTAIEPTTPSPPPATEEAAILLLAPTPGFGFEQGDTIFFDWYWPIALESDQQFVIQLEIDDELQTVGTASSPISGSQYRVSVDFDAFDLKAGSYNWFVALEMAETAETIVSSEQQSFVIQAQPATATPSPSPTIEILSGTPSPTPAASCVPTRPTGWVSYTVQQGDFLFNLALETGTTVARIQEVNCLDEPIIGTGIRLWLPSLPATKTPTPAPTATESQATSPSSQPPRATKTPLPPPLPSPIP